MDELCSPVFPILHFPFVPLGHTYEDDIYAQVKGCSQLSFLGLSPALVPISSSGFVTDRLEPKGRRDYGLGPTNTFESSVHYKVNQSKRVVLRSLNQKKLIYMHGLSPLSLPRDLLVPVPRSHNNLSHFQGSTG